MHPTLALLQDVASSGLPQAAPQFSILQLGKALFTLSLFTLVTLAATARAMWHLMRDSKSLDERRSMADLCLFWGAFTFGVGAFHTLMGLVVTLWSMQMAAPIEPGEHALVAGGVMTACLAGVWGLVVFLLTSLAWLGLRGPGNRPARKASYDSLSASVG